ncbi:MAG TPA: hypothetical protein VF163_19590 [Micromonosporaceae bacterium]
MTRAELVFVLQAVQPLTTDPGAAASWPDCEMVVLADRAGSPFREDVLPLPHRVVQVPVAGWREAIVRQAAGRSFDVVTNDEYALLACRLLRAEFGLAPRHPDGLIGYLDKVVMKQRLSEAGVDTPRYVALEPVVAVDGTAEALVFELGLPMVAKPRQEANSRGVVVLATVDEVHDWLRRRDGQSGWQVEEFVAGPQYHVNAVVCDGSVVPVQVGRYLGPLLELPQGRRLGWRDLVR